MKTWLKIGETPHYSLNSFDVRLWFDDIRNFIDCIDKSRFSSYPTLC